ncbi:MAG: hypothetical protein ACXAAO_14155 [Candidatus Thorarchaeota archaeon]|jgi:hypothetical protein
MSQTFMPWSYYAVILTFGIFFASINIYIFTLWLAHPLASPFWLIGVMIGGVGLIYSIKMVRVHQQVLVKKKLLEENGEEKS